MPVVTHTSKSSYGTSLAPHRVSKVERDIVALGILVSATLMFVGTGSSVLSQLVKKFQGLGLGPDVLLTNALLLNVALVIFGYRRYRELCFEVEQRRQAEERARLLAETDPMTGCLNRRSVGPATDRLIEEARTQGEIAAFIMIDIDNFKQINDTNGHAVGDRIIIECARRLRAALPPQALAARLGGDEFACVVPFSPQNPERIERLAYSIISAISAPISAGSFNGSVTVSLGLTRSDRMNRLGSGAADASGLLHMADIAMYQAKKQGRNRFYWFEDTMESELRYRSEMEIALRQGLSRGEFVPYFQPIVDMQTGQTTGFEMLARWMSPTFGLVEPGVFVPIAEEIGAIGELFDSLLARALAEARGWDASLSLSVNVSALQMRDPWFAQKLLKALVAAQFPPSRLEIEITETALHQNGAVAQTLITSLKNQGIALALDDFGSGYSSLAQLRKLPFDRLKIDRAFVLAMSEDSDALTIVEAIVQLAKGLGLAITAEGVEGEREAEMLRALAPMRAQGYVYGRPLSAAATSALLEAPAEAPRRSA